MRVHLMDTLQGSVTVYKGKSSFGERPAHALDEGWKGDEVRGGTHLIEIPIRTG